MKFNFLNKGFTLVELMVVIGIIGILSSIVYANLSSSKSVARDSLRKTDLKNMELAVKLYKAQTGHYPIGCKGSGAWSGALSGSYSCGANYIVGLTPDFISVLPSDAHYPSTANVGYIYRSDGNDYKIMAHQSVESAKIKSFSDEFARCPSVGGSCASLTPAIASTYAVYSGGAAGW